MKTVLRVLVVLVIVNPLACSTGAKPKDSGSETAATPALQTQSEQHPPRIDADPVLTIKVKDKTIQFRRSQLLQSPYLVTLDIAKDPAYGGKKTTYQAVPVAGLFQGMRVEDKATMVFNCYDGFSAPISASRLLNVEPSASIAYIAIEPADKKWPPVKEGATKTAGPFYLVWDRPEKSAIVTEEWPYQLAGFEAKPSFESLYPLTAPSETLTEKGRIRTGYRAFQKNCFACHTLNRQGTSQMGPDLNVPHNPTEYMKPKYLKMLIRNPQDLRHWPQSKMAAITTESLSDTDLQNIYLYLEHMASRKP